MIVFERKNTAIVQNSSSLKGKVISNSELSGDKIDSCGIFYIDQCLMLLILEKVNLMIISNF